MILPRHWKNVSPIKTSANRIRTCVTINYLAVADVSSLRVGLSVCSQHCTCTVLQNKQASCAFMIIPCSLFRVRLFRATSFGHWAKYDIESMHVKRTCGSLFRCNLNVQSERTRRYINQATIQLLEVEWHTVVQWRKGYEKFDVLTRVLIRPAQKFLLKLAQLLAKETLIWRRENIRSSPSSKVLMEMESDIWYSSVFNRSAIIIIDFVQSNQFLHPNEMMKRGWH